MNVFQKICESCDQFKDRPALEMLLNDGTSRTYTYSQLMENILNFSRHLKNNGIRAGDRVTLIGENSPEWVIACLSILSINGTAVFIDASLQKAEIAEFIRRSDVRGMMMSPAVIAKLGDVSDLPFPAFNILGKTSTFSGAMPKIDKGGLGTSSKNVPSSPHDDGRGPLELCGCLPSVPGTVDPECEIAAILYSSGTTSTSKGVMHTHQGICAMAAKNIENNRLNENDRLLAILPLYHIFGFMAKLVCPLFCGASVYFLESVTSEHLSTAFQKVKPTVFCAVPRVFDMLKTKILDIMKAKGAWAFGALKFLMKCSAQTRSRFGMNVGKPLFQAVHEVFGNHLRLLVSGGTAISDETVRFFYALGFNLFNNYGITETNLPVAANSFAHFSIGTAGKPYHGVDIKIHKPDTKGVGEILVHSPGLMKGYFRDPDATKAAFNEEGWFFTGDLGYSDSQGNLVVCGRLKENILCANGKKVAPNDLEKKYEGIEGVSDLAICGIATRLGAYDEVHAFVVKDKTVNIENTRIDAAIRNIGAGLSLEMRISQIHFVSEIPRTSIQKPKRYLLKQMVQNNVKTLTGAETQAVDGARKESRGSMDTVAGIISHFDFCKSAVTAQSRLFEDLGFDSLSVTEFCVLLEKETGRNISKMIKPHISVGEILTALDEMPGDTPNVQEERGIPISKYPLKRGNFERWILNSVGLLTKFVFQFEIQGLENLPDQGGYLLCPNHETYLDSMNVLIHLPEKHRQKCCGLAKIELAGSLWGRFALRVGGGIPVNRVGDPGQSLQRCFEKLREGWIVLIHPEGTRTLDGKLGEFKKGAAKLAIESGKPIVPVRIKGAYEIFPRSRLLPHLFNFRTFRRHKIGISFGKPLFPEHDDIETLTEILRKRILDL